MWLYNLVFVFVIFLVQYEWRTCFGANEVTKKYFIWDKKYNSCSMCLPCWYPVEGDLFGRPSTQWWQWYSITTPSSGPRYYYIITILVALNVLPYVNRLVAYYFQCRRKGGGLQGLEPPIILGDFMNTFKPQRKVTLVPLYENIFLHHWFTTFSVPDWHLEQMYLPSNFLIMIIANFIILIIVR